MRRKVVRPFKTVKHNVLDMRVVSKIGEELQKVINDSCAATQSPIILEHPDMIVVSPSQFTSLLPYTEEMENTTDRLFFTAQGFVCEVQVVDMDQNVVPLMAINKTNRKLAPAKIVKGEVVVHG